MGEWDGGRSSWVVDRLAGKQDLVWSLMGNSVYWASEEGLGSQSWQADSLGAMCVGG